MATNQMPAPSRSGSTMSGWLKLVSPALKLMKVLTTATEASAISVAAGMPSSRTSPEDCRVKRPPEDEASGGAADSLIRDLRIGWNVPERSNLPTPRGSCNPPGSAPSAGVVRALAPLPIGPDRERLAPQRAGPRGHGGRHRPAVVGER